MGIESYIDLKSKRKSRDAKICYIPSMAWRGYFVGTEGNTFGLHQADTNAK